MTIKDQRIIITGGSSGIGLALAEHFVKHGAHVALMARNQQRLDEAKATCLALCCNAAQKVATFSVDLSDHNALLSTTTRVLKEFGSPDILITSAGQVVSNRFLATEPSVFDQIIDINLKGTRDFIRALLPSMINRKSGQVVLIASMAGLVPTYGYSAYNASKFALVGFSGALRQEMREHNIRVSTVCPPEVATPMVELEAETILPQTRLLKDMCGTLSTEQVIKETIQGMQKNQRLIIPGFLARMTYRLYRWFPGIFTVVVDWILARRG
ncbi:MAG: SDR family oxidoreductase [Colwellia sp.]